MIARLSRARARIRPLAPFAMLVVGLLLVGTACEPFVLGQTALVPESSEPPPAEAAPLTIDANLMHGDCRYCHVEGKQVVKSNPSPIPHQTTGWEECSFCHSDGRLAPIPVQHGPVADSECQMCHKPSATAPPQMAHLSFKDRTCTSCHGPLVALGSTHATRSEYTCELCHQAPAKAPPSAPHAVIEGQACSGCHGDGRSLTLPASHAGRKDQLCVLCHQGEPGTTLAIPHGLQNREQCLDCHVAKTGQAPAKPASPISSAR